MVKKLIDEYSAVIKLTESGDKLKVDQEHVQTVIPAIGKTVLLVNGIYRGEEAILEALNERHFSCNVRLLSGTRRGLVIADIQYEDLSKKFMD